MATTNAVQAGDFVTLERTRGWATPTPVTTTVSGVAALDEEGVLRVEGVNVTQDEQGYYPQGVVVLSIA